MSRLLTLALLLVVAASCSPVAASSALSRASEDLRYASKSGAARYEPGTRHVTKAQFKYFAAQRYLEKAREFNGGASYDSAILLANESSKLAREAVEDIKRYESLTKISCFPEREFSLPQQTTAPSDGQQKSGEEVAR